MVGGAVRDRLLQRPVHDTDWVVVGATPEDMTARGFTPVGRDFPVFLHPETHEEYALARTERKSGRGYRGFTVYTAPDVTLEEDLARRDLTINAIAAPAGWTGAEDVFDPYHGQADLHARVLRHVTEAFREDPVRILRVARFAARFTDFHVAPETMALMRHGGSGRSRPPGARAGLAGNQPGADGGPALAHVRRAARLRSPGRAAARAGPPVGRAPARRIPPRGGQRRARHAGAGHGRAAASAADACAWPAWCHDLGKGTTPAEMLPRHIGHEQRSARLVQARGRRWRVPKECTRAGRRGGARARQHPPQPGI